MNIFFLDPDPSIAAAMLCDKHLSKMQLETAQLISTAFSYSTLVNHQVSESPGFELACSIAYKPTHAKHPSSVWARSSNANLRWLLGHASGMAAEWQLRQALRGKPAVSHRSWNVSHTLAMFLLDSCNQICSYTRRSFTGKLLPDEFTEVPLCMPEDLYAPGGKFVQSISEAAPFYRAYYARDKAGFAKWPESRVPDWWQPSHENAIL